MSTTPGAFNETTLQNIRMLAENLTGFDVNIKKQLQPQADILKAIWANQTARLTYLEDKKKDFTVEVEWLNACGLETRSCTPCTFGGTELSSNTQTYTMSNCKEVAFSVNENDFRGNDFDMEQAVALGFLKADKELIEEFPAWIVAQIEANKGVNAFTGGKGNVVSTETYISAPYWDAKLMAYFARAAKVNKFNSPYLLDGSNLYEQQWNAEQMRGNADGKFDSAAFSTMPYFVDLVNIDSINTPDLKTYMIDGGSIAIANKALYTPTVATYTDQKRYSMRSALAAAFGGNLEYDVRYTTTCSGNTFIHEFVVMLRAGVYVAPAGCTSGETGILSFTCGAAPAN